VKVKNKNQRKKVVRKNEREVKKIDRFFGE